MAVESENKPIIKTYHLLYYCEQKPEIFRIGNLKKGIKLAEMR
jgi:hypothetical protein